MILIVCTNYQVIGFSMDMRKNNIELVKIVYNLMVLHKK